MYYYGRLRDLREDADLTQKDVGKILNTTRNNMQNTNWVCRRYPPTTSSHWQKLLSCELVYGRPRRVADVA